MLSMLLWKEFQLLHVLNDLPTKHLIKLTLYENDVKLLKFKRRPVYVNLQYVWGVRFWLLIPEMNASRQTMEWLIYFSIVNLTLGYLLYKKFKKCNESCSFSKGVRILSTYLK